MKKLFVFIAVLAFLIPVQKVHSQVLSEKAKRKFTVGADVFTDLWQVTNQAPYIPSRFDTRTINQGATAFFMYNFLFGESLSAFSLGLAIRNHNLYSNSIVENIKADTIMYTLVSDYLSGEGNYRRSKINTVYLDLPIEVKIRTEKGFKLVIGFKVGYLIDSKQKYVGDRPGDLQGVKFKEKKVNRLEKWAYGATLRVGYKWISVYGYYQFSKMFQKSLGPEIYPVSLGITIAPF
ncbi:MAG: outer membrane beta-barrel protein [bacterium]